MSRSVPTLEFNGTPNEIQTGVIEYMITSNTCQPVTIQILGTAFSNGSRSLETEYQTDSDPNNNWHKAGEVFKAKGVPGAINKIQFRASTGSSIASQCAGVYNAALSVRAVKW